MTRFIILAFTFTMTCAGPVSAQPGADAASIRTQIDQRNEEWRRLLLEQSANNANLSNLRDMRANAARVGNAALVKEYDQSIQDLQADNKANQEQQVRTREQMRTLNEELKRVAAGATVSPPPAPQVGGLPQGSVGAPPLRKPPCESCSAGVKELEREHQDLQRRAELANARRFDSDRRDFEQQRRKVRDLQRKIDDCDRACLAKPAATPSAFLNPRVIGGAAGGAALALLLTRDGGDPNLVTPIANQPPTTQPPTTQPPTTQPPTTQPPTPPTIAGVHDAVECIVLDDPGNQNQAIRLCDQAGGPWEVVVASISIRHGAPFVNIEGAPFDTATGEFGGATRGTVAGIPNVTVEFEGIADVQSGRIRLVYGMGTGGELPGGQPVIYGITLQKRP